MSNKQSVSAVSVTGIVCAYRTAVSHSGNINTMDIYLQNGHTIEGLPVPSLEGLRTATRVRVTVELIPETR